MSDLRCTQKVKIVRLIIKTLVQTLENMGCHLQGILVCIHGSDGITKMINTDPEAIELVEAFDKYLIETNQLIQRGTNEVVRDPIN